MALDDPVLPTLAAVFDTGTVAAALVEALRRDEGRSVTVADLVLRRFRYRRGERAILLYELRWREGDAARRTWLTGNLYPGEKAAVIAGKLRRAGGGGVRTTWLAPLRLLLAWFPLDRRLPGLARLMGTLERRSDALLAGVTTAELVRYRPHLAATLRLERRGADPVYAKLYPDAEAAERAWRRQEALTSAADRDGVPAVPAAVAHLAWCDAVLLAPAPGRSLAELARGPEGAVAARQAAAALHALHAGLAGLGEARSTEAMLAKLRRAGRVMEQLAPTRQGRVEALLQGIAAGLEGGPRAPAHLDLKPDHLFLDGARVSLIDWDSAALFDPLADAANLFVRLEAQDVELAMTFLDAYAARLPAAAWRRWAPHEAGARLKLAADMLLELPPSAWSEVAESHLRGAEAVLARAAHRPAPPSGQAHAPAVL